MTEPTYVQGCAGCAYWQVVREDEGLCRRHAPDATIRAETVAHWPQTHGHQGCGDGEPAGGARLVSCAECRFWRRYKGGLHPMNRSDMPNSWWSRAGLCARRAPSPSTEPGPRGFWRATVNTDGCGEGVAIEVPSRGAVETPPPPVV